MNILFLKHLGPIAINFLTALFNLSISNADVPSIWKLANIIPIRKPGKPPNEGGSYRPISLLCPAVKVLERLILPYLTSTLDLANSQHGFRALRSTSTALLPLVDNIARGFNQPKPPLRTVSLAVDFSRAFDTVSHDLLINMIGSSDLPHNIVRWVASYLHGRAAAVLYQGHRSPYRPLKAGVPQGSVISPSLFNYYVSDYPEHSAELATSYADDFTVAVSASDVDVASNQIQQHTLDLENWATIKALKISLDKTHSTLFTSDTHQSHFIPQISLGQHDISLERRPKYLGVVFDTHLTFSPHIRYIAERCCSRLKLLAALAGTRWGQQKETLAITYKSLIRSIITYAAPIWYPNSSSSAIQRLQSIQNSALRIATGAHRMSAISHLHNETMILPVKDSLELQCKQFLLSASRPLHPSFDVVTSPSGPRRIKNTLQSRFTDSISHLLNGNALPPDEYRSALKNTHTQAVEQAIAAFPPNRVLGTEPPPIHPEEQTLSRPHRSTLAQLRSGFCSALRSYQYRIGSYPSPNCPDCNAPDHSVSHVFSCPAFPTLLSPSDLWENPAAVIHFLSTTPSFSYLPPAARPPPEPPPGPP